MASIKRIRASDETGNASQPTVTVLRSPGATSLTVDTVAGIYAGSEGFYASMGTPHTFTDPITGETITVISEATAVDFRGHIDTGNIIIDAIAPGYTDAGSKVGDIVVIRPTTQWSDNLADTLAVSLNDDGTLNTAAINQATPAGVMSPYAGRTAPSGWLLCEGSAQSRTTYANLFAAIVPLIGTFTVTLATPGVFTLNNHGLNTGAQIYLKTTGALPTGLSANTLYYVVKIDANTFNLATSRANAYAGTKIATSGSQSGTHSLYGCPFGLGDGSTTFNVPDSRGRVLAGDDAMGGTAASRLTLAQSQGSYGNLGATGGEQGHQLVTGEVPSHTHTTTGGGSFIGGGSGSAANVTVGGGSYVVNNTTNSVGGDGSHNNVQPTLVVNHIIKT